MIGAQCLRRPDMNGRACERAAEVRVHLVQVSSGLTLSKEPMCPVHAYEMVARAFLDVDRPQREPLTVVISPLQVTPTGDPLPYSPALTPPIGRT